MVLVAERLKGGPVSSRVSTFLDVFSVTKGGPKCAEVVENHGFDGDWRLESLLTMGACLSRSDHSMCWNRISRWCCKRTGEVQVISEDLI